MVTEPDIVSFRVVSLGVSDIFCIKDFKINDELHFLIGFVWGFFFQGVSSEVEVA